MSGVSVAHVLYKFAQRKGVGKALMTKVLKEAETRDIRSVYTFVRVDNKVGHFVLFIMIFIKYHFRKGRVCSCEKVWSGV